MRKLILTLLWFIPLLIQGQSEGILLEEVVIESDINYNSNSVYIKGSDDQTFQYNILDMENNHTIMTGKLSSLDPMKRTGNFTFYTPDGRPYASAYYNNNYPFRAWSIFDGEGQVINTLNYSSALQFLKTNGNIDLGDDLVTSLKKTPGYRKKDIEKWRSFLKENIVYPPYSLINSEQGRVLCQFVIDTSGKLINLKIIEGVNEDLDLEVIRILSLTPQWKALKVKGNPVNVLYTLPVIFKLPVPAVAVESPIEPDSQ